MGHVSITVNGRSYRLACGEGEEPRLNAIGQHVSMTVDKLVAEFGQIGTERLLVMAAILISDELFDLHGMPSAPETAKSAEASEEEDDGHDFSQRKSGVA